MLNVIFLNILLVEYVWDEALNVKKKKTLYEIFLTKEIQNKNQ